MQTTRKRKYGDGAHAQARKKHAADTNHYDRHSTLSNDGGGTIRIKDVAMRKGLSNPVAVQMNAEQIPAVCFQQANAFFDIEIVGSSAVGYADHMIVQLTLRNPDPINAMTLGHFFQLWDKIELLPDGSNVQDTLYPEMMYLMHQLKVKDEYRSMIGDNYGLNTGTNRDPTVNRYTYTNYDSSVNGQGVIIAPGASFTYYAEIPCIFQYMDLFLPALDVNKWPRIRFYPAATNCKQTTSVSLLRPTIQQCILVIQGPQFAGGINTRLKNAYRKAPSVTSGIVCDRQIISPYTPASGRESGDIVLNSTVGKMLMLILIQRNTVVTGEELFSAGTLVNATWHEIDTFTFKRGGGAVVSYEKQPKILYDTTYFTDYFPSNLAREKAFLLYSFSTDPMSSIIHGADTGSYVMTAKEAIRITPISVPHNTFVDGVAMELLCYAFRYAEITQCKGGVELTRK